mmetsp:Transcript_4184/g.26526  ORF Transcript_4184/g.26526 Transcript_4184/m.26526 type:complete len:106 (+) Transcript_4184:1818-2135(+)
MKRKLRKNGQRTTSLSPEKSRWMLDCGPNCTTNMQWIDQVDQTETDLNPDLIVTQSILWSAMYEGTSRGIALFVDEDRSIFVRILFLRIRNGCQTCLRAHCRDMA